MRPRSPYHTADDDDDIDLPEHRRRRRQRNYYRRQATAIYELQMREAVIRLTHEGVSDAEIAKQLGQSVGTIKRYRQRALDRAVRHERHEAIYGKALPPPPRTTDPRYPYAKHNAPGRTVSVKRPPVYWPANDRREASSPLALPSPGRVDAEDWEEPVPDPQAAHRFRSAPDPDLSSASSVPPGSTTTSEGPTYAGTVFDPLDPEVLRDLREKCLWLRKAAIPFPEMAIKLGISEAEARQFTYEALHELQTSELHTADLERRLMIEQLDDMIRAIRPMALGHPDHHPPLLDAVDRVLKLMKQKADLMGLSQPPAVDIMIRLQGLAAESGYDILDLQDIARDVLAANKIKLPEYRAS